MSKTHSQHVTTAPKIASQQTLPSAQGAPCCPFWVRVALLVAPFLLLGGVLAWALHGSSVPPGAGSVSDGTASAGFEPISPDDLIVDRYARRVNKGDRTAVNLLGPAAVFNAEPVSEVEADARFADYYLRRPDLRIEAIRRGEMVGGKKIQTPGRYTLVTKVQGSTPPLRVRDATGKIEPPSQWSMKNPDIVIEVHDGKIHAVRADLHSD